MTTRPVWLASLETLVGAHLCETHTTRLQEYAVDGLIPSAVVWPETVEQAAVLQWAQREKLAGTLWKRHQNRAGKYSEASRYRAVDAPPHPDQRVRRGQLYDHCRSGDDVRAAHSTDRGAHADAATPIPFSTATLGGLIAANAYTPKRLRYGGVRDLLLGLRIALPSGEIAHFGGRVVKNVAGYDMCKLFLGSLGALGIIVEATFKLYALPERDETLLAVLPSLEPGAAAVAAAHGNAAATLTNPAPRPNRHTSRRTRNRDHGIAGTALLLVNCEGMDEAVERQLAEWHGYARGMGPLPCRWSW